MGRLFWKFFLFFFFAQLTSALAVGVFIQFRANDRASKIKLDLSPMSQSLVEAAQTTLELGGTNGLKQLLQRWEAQNPNHHVYVVDQNNDDLLNRSIQPILLTKAMKSSSVASTKSISRVNINGNSYLIFVGFRRPDRTEARLAPQQLEDESMRPKQDNRYLKPHGRPIRLNPIFRTITTFPIEALMVASIASAIFAALLAWYFSKPIDDLRRAFKRAAEGDLQFSVANKMGSRNDELSDLGRHFDEMIKRLNALMQGQRRLLHHVSHELRSPLARMQMALGLAKQNPVKTKESVDRIEREAGRMDKLIGELLELSRFESGMVSLEKEVFSFNALLDTIIEDAAFEASTKNMRILKDIQGAINFNGQMDLLYRAIENVVRNAVKYGPENSDIKINITTDVHQLTINITDYGVGVQASELEDIFMPFVRGNSGSQVIGHGIGLAISKQVVEAHGGWIVATNLKSIGFCVSLNFPSSCYTISPDT
ncbi:MAG: ATP-binding protein [Methylophilaceae bacterium]